MICFAVTALALVLFQASACPDPITTVHIQNHDGPIYVSPDRAYDHQITIGNRGTCNRPTCNQPTCNQLLHTYPYHICESDCKCVTKQLSTCVPINTVPQNMCSQGSYGYPEYTYGYGYGPDGCSVASEGLIPLLKSYAGQSKHPKHGCQCVQCY